MANGVTDNNQSKCTASNAKSKAIAIGVVLLSVVTLLIGIRSTVAAFSANDYLKAVAATNEAPNLLSSDLLASYSSEPADKDVPVKSVTVSSEDPTLFSFSIFNYLQNDPTIWCQKDIYYDIEVSVKGSQKATDCTMNGTAFAGGSVKLAGQHLQARQKSCLTYTVTLPKADVNNAIFEVRVSVTDSGGTTIRSMAANIAPSQEATVAPSHIDVSSADKTSTNSPSDFDAYNYDVTVSGKQTKVTLTWNASFVQLDPFFEEKHEGAGVSFGEDGHSASFTMDPGTMRINFYRLNGTVAGTWEELGIKDAS